MDKSQILLVAKELQIETSSATNTVIFHGKSMLPWLVDGDELVIAPVDWDRIRKGDLITYRFEDKFPTRRVVMKRGDKLALWCEGWPDRRFSCGRADVLGQAVAWRHGDGWLKAEDSRWQAWTLRAMLMYAAIRTRENVKQYGVAATIRTIRQKAVAKTRHLIATAARQKVR